MTRQLIVVDWRVPLGIHDAIQSLLVEHPDSFYMSDCRQWLYYLTRDHGLIQLTHDFSLMTDEEISDYIIGVLEMFET